MSTPAYAVAEPKAPLAPWTIERRAPGAHEVQLGRQRGDEVQAW